MLSMTRLVAKMKSYRPLFSILKRFKSPTNRCLKARVAIVLTHRMNLPRKPQCSRRGRKPNHRVSTKLRKNFNHLFQRVTTSVVRIPSTCPPISSKSWQKKMLRPPTFYSRTLQALSRRSSLRWSREPQTLWSLKSLEVPTKIKVIR
jgi:hypothetical protein